MHTLFDFEGNLPIYMNLTDGKTADNKGAYDMPLIKNSVVVADRFYNDLFLWNNWDSNGVFFVVRHKENLQFDKITENQLPDNRHEHVLIDEIIKLNGPKSKRLYPQKLRRIAIWDDKNQ